jgi:tripartite-type tricarboxylate transporter receptor subunit TctC
MDAIRRRQFVAAGAAFAGASLLPLRASAQDFPSKPVRLIVPFPAGGPSDTTARSIGDGLGKLLGQPVVVENKPGAGAIVGSQFVLGQPADGHTLLMGSNILSTGKSLYPAMTYDPLREFRAVAGVFRSPHQVVVGPSVKAQGIQDLIAMAREARGKMQYASSGAGTMPHLGAELFKQATGVDMQAIPYRGSAPALAALIAGEVPVYFDIEFSCRSMLQAGRLRSLGVTALQRSTEFPNVPTLDEQGVKGFELYSWFGIVARAETPDGIVQRLNRAMNQVMGTAEFNSRLAALGAQKIGGAPSVFQKMMVDDAKLWGGVIKKANIQLD